MPLPTPDEQQKLAEVDPEIHAIMQTPQFKSITPIDYTDPTKGIMSLRALMRRLGETPPDPQVTDSEASYPARDGTQLRLVIYTPATASETTVQRPLLVWFHGGGGVSGTPEMSATFCRSIARTQSCTVVCPEYRLGPEWPFPTCIHDSWDALRYVAAHASSSRFHADPSLGFLLGGESFGAIIGAVLSLMARDNDNDDLPSPLTGVFLCAGSYVPPLAVPERYVAHYTSRFDPACLSAPGLTGAAKVAFDQALKPDYGSPLYRAVLWPTGHRGLPRTYFQTCGMDINRDDAFVYRDVLDESGVETRLDVYPGTPHCFWWTFPNVQMTNRWRDDTAKGVAWLLGREGV